MRDPAKLRLVAEAEELAVAVYAATATFPATERFGLTGQLRRAAVSVGSNIVEGSQRQGNNAFRVFLHHALVSAAEIQFQISLARRLGFGNAEQLKDLQIRANRVQRMLARLILVLREKGD
jgi:four helix bundle protein